MTVIKNSNCSSCDGGCCRIFILPLKTQFLDRLNPILQYQLYGLRLWRWGFFSHKWIRTQVLKNLYSIIFSWLFLVKIKDPEIVSFCDGAVFEVDNNVPVSCRLIGNRGCRAYKLRPFFCAGYDCGDRPQLYHEIRKRKGLELPPHILRYHESEKKHLTDGVIKDGKL